MPILKINAGVESAIATNFMWKPSSGNYFRAEAQTDRQTENVDFWYMVARSAILVAILPIDRGLVSVVSNIDRYWLHGGFM